MEKETHKPTSKEYAIEFCRQHDINVNLWGDINDVICDGYFQSRMEFNPVVQLFEEKAIEEIKNNELEKAKIWLLAARTIKEVALHRLPTDEAFKHADNDKEIETFIKLITSFQK